VLRVEFHPKARRELAEAAQWFNERSDNLGEALLDEVDAATARLLIMPGMGSLIRHRRIPPGHRKWVLARFRYILVYRVVNQVLWVVAVAHTSRKPGYWADRL